MRRRYVSVLALALLGAAALAASFILTPTPDTFAQLDGHRVRIPADMHAVDYAIIVCRIGGFVALLTGIYLTYRRWRPDQIQESEGLPRHGFDPHEDLPPEGGDPAARATIMRRG
ncbi:MAG: hypothetical protein ACRDQC_03835 [Gaiellales bacterium]